MTLFKPAGQVQSPEPGNSAARFAVLADALWAGVALVAWEGLMGQLRLTWTWAGPGALLAAWTCVRLIKRPAWEKWRGQLLTAGIVVAVAILLPAWPGAS